MDRTDSSHEDAEVPLRAAEQPSDGPSHPEIEPDSWRDLTEFVEQFSDVAVFGVLADPSDEPEGFWIVGDTDRVRPAAVPIDQGPTFDLSVLGAGGEVVDEIRLTIDEIEHVRAAEPSGVSEGSDEA